MAAALPALRQAASDSRTAPEPPKPILLPDALARASRWGFHRPFTRRRSNRQTNLFPRHRSPGARPYTIRSRPQDGGFIHHVSVSLGGGYTPHGVGALPAVCAARARRRSQRCAAACRPATSFTPSGTCPPPSTRSTWPAPYPSRQTRVSYLMNACGCGRRFPCRADSLFVFDLSA